MKPRTLFPLPPATGALTIKQEDALEYIASQPTGARSIDLGRHLHILRGCPYCNPDRSCKYAHTTGEEVGRQLRKRELAIKRKTGLWELLPAARPRDSGELPEGF